jgi:hypothetical protein
MRDRGITIAIAVSQLLLSLMFLELGVVDGLSPFLTIFAVWGLINACVLFSFRVLARV